MPQTGQLPGPSRTISGCIGQVQELALSREGAALAREGAALALEGAALSREGTALAREGTALSVVGLRLRCSVATTGCDPLIPAGPRASQPAGSAVNFVRQPGLQK
jgi:hypothetical protein